jgi:hypothetical protein
VPAKRVINPLVVKLGISLRVWRGGRVAEGPALEKRYPVKNGIVGSNPTLSANLFSYLAPLLGVNKRLVGGTE